MGFLYSKADFEQDMERIEQLRHVNRTMLVDGDINGFRFNTIANKLDEMERSCRGKLRMTALRMQEKDQMRRERNARVPVHRVEPILDVEIRIIRKEGKKNG